MLKNNEENNIKNKEQFLTNKECLLTIIIVTYNSSAVIEECLSKLNFSKYKVIVVDNDSKDNTIKIISKSFPQLEIIKSSENIGYGRANNIALRQVKTEYSLILNPDALIFENDVELVLFQMKQNKNIAIAGPIQLEKLPLKNLENQRVVSSLEKDNLSEIYETNFVSGACLFLRMSIVKEIGFFDENIFLFYEDNEICQRSINNKFLNIIVKDAYFYHISGKSSGNKTSISYRRGWHLSWSKLYFRNSQDNRLFRTNIVATTRAFKFLLKFFFKVAFFKQKEAISNLGFAVGSFAFLIGLKAFDKKGNPRG